MRKSDLEMLEVRLEPLQTARDRIEAELGEHRRTLADMGGRVKDLERNEETHKTEIAQGLASIRSLLQRANRAARDVGIVDDEELDPAAKPMHVGAAPRTSDQIHADARARNPERNVL